MPSGIVRYRVHRQVHEGLYGPTLRAEDTETGHPVALQRILVARAEQAIPRLSAQIEMQRKLALTGVRAPLDAGVHPDGGVFLAWKWAEGQPLRLPTKRPAQALNWVLQVAAILEDAHRNGLVHLLLRPSQILLSGARGERSVCALLGLGLTSALGLPSKTLGPQVLDYVAPEIRRAEPIESEAADVFSLGRILRGLLGLPLIGPAGDLSNSVLTLSNSQKQALSALLERMLHTSPDKRPPMGEVNASLRSLLQPRSAAPIIHIRETPPPSVPSDGDPLIGQEFGNFRILRRLGQGGMGTVYEAKHKLIGSRAAIKVMKESLASPDYARRFLDEARAVNIAAHPGIVSIFEFGQRPQDKLLYIIMEHLQGTTIERLLDQRQAPLPEAELLPVALQIARALEAAHGSKVIHRDLKPSNVMLVPDPLSPSMQRVKILDFGIAKVRRRETPTGEDRTEVGAVMGTPAYMAPEQYRDASSTTGKADVFALGVMLFEALTCRHPFGGANTMAVLTGPAPLVRSLQRSVSAELSNLVAAMLHADPDARPTMAEVAAAIERRVARGAWHTPLRIAAAALGATALAGVAAFLLSRPPSLTEVEARYASMRLRASKVLLKEVQPEQPPSERLAAVRALGEARDPTYRTWLIPLIGDGDRQVACAASAALGNIGDPSDGAALSTLLDHPDDLPLRLCATSALLKLQTSPERKQALTLARELLRDIRLPEKAGTAEIRAELAVGLLGAGEIERGEEITRALIHPELRGAKRLYYLERLAEQTSGAAATAQLRRISTDSTVPSTDVLVALTALIRLGQASPEERRQFIGVAEQPGPNQLLASLLRLRVDGEANCDLFWRVLEQDSEAEERRQVAADGLSRCGSRYAGKLDRLLDSLIQRPLLRISVAESLLRIVGPDWQRNAGAQQRFVRDYQSGASLAERLGYLDSIEGLPDEQSAAALTRVLREDGEDRIRVIAAQKLRPERARSVLAALVEDLSDARSDTYQRGLRAVSSVIALIDAEPPVRLQESLRSRLHERLSRPLDEAEELVLRTLLLRCGEREQAAILNSKLPTLDKQHALLAIELSDPRSELVTAALVGPDPSLRLAAAQHRVEHGVSDRTTKRTLTELLQHSGSASLLAYILLRGVGERPERPPHLPDLIGRGESLPVRWSATHLLAQLPLSEAVPLLGQASTDPAAVIRHEVVQAAWTLYQRSPDQRLIDLIIALTSDPELPVRLKAARVLSQLSTSRGRSASGEPALPPVPVPVPKPPAQAPAQALLAPAPTGKPPANAAQPSYLSVLLPQGVRARVLGNGISQELAGSKDLSLPSGRYRITASCEETLAVELRPGERKSARLCEATQIVDQVRALRQSGNLAEAQKVLDRLLVQLKGRESSVLYERARFERGELLAASGSLDSALGEFNSVWRRHLSQPSSVVPTISQKLSLLRSRVGRLSVYSEAGGKCTLIEDGLYMAGQMIRSRLLTEGVIIRAGEHSTFPAACRNIGRP